MVVAGVDAGERTHQVGYLDVVGAEMGREAPMHGLHVLRHGPVTRDAAQTRLPGVNVTVDQAGDHDHCGGIDECGGIDDLRIARLDRRADCGNALVLHHKIATHITCLPVHRNDRAIFDQMRDMLVGPFGCCSCQYVSDAVKWLQLGRSGSR
jgi:hypothetical protein